MPITTNIKTHLKSLPEEPGIYKMCDVNDTLLYVGKAKNIKKRVASYFSKTHEDFKTTVLVSKIHSIDIIVTHSEQEALILERQLIRAFKPRYNILLKDDKSYPYIKVTAQDPFPRVLVVREKKKDGALYFGPYPSIGGAHLFQRTLHELFQIRDCKKPIDLVKKQRKCIQLDIGNCVGPCIKKEVKAAYDALIRELILLLKGNNKRLIQQLKKDMANLSKKQEYEKAAIVRDKILKLESLYEKQSVDGGQSEDFHIWTSSENNEHLYVLVQEIHDGKLLFQHGFYVAKKEFDSKEDVIIQSWLDRYVDKEKLPKTIICNTDIKTILLKQKDLTSNTKCRVPQRGRKKDLLDLAQKNAKLALSRIQKEAALTQVKHKKETGLIETIKNTLKLNTLPQLITGCDISHLQGTNIVASAVRFKEGEPYKKEYRKLNIKTVKGKSNDPESMKEAVYRILNHYLNNKMELPDLIVIDGGRAQLNFAVEAMVIIAYEQTKTRKKAALFMEESRQFLNTHGYISINEKDVSVVSLAKREEELYFPHKKKTLCLEKTNETLLVLQYVRDESHRFAVSFQRVKRRKDM